MLSTFFSVQARGSAKPKEFKVKGRSKKPAAKVAKREKDEGRDKVLASEASTTVLHAQFNPLPPETHVPRAYEADEAYELHDSDDEVANEEQWDFVREDADREETALEDDAESDFIDDESRDESRDESSELSQSYDEPPPIIRRRSSLMPRPVYAGPQLCLEDDDFLD